MEREKDMDGGRGEGCSWKEREQSVGSGRLEGVWFDRGGRACGWREKGLGWGVGRGMGVWVEGDGGVWVEGEGKGC